MTSAHSPLLSQIGMASHSACEAFSMCQKTADDEYNSADPMSSPLTVMGLAPCMSIKVRVFKVQVAVQPKAEVLSNWFQASDSPFDTPPTHSTRYVHTYMFIGKSFTFIGYVVRVRGHLYWYYSH